MAAPKPFSITRPTVATEIPVRTVNRERKDYGPNFFLQADPEGGAPKGWFLKSYEEGVWCDVPTTGDFEIGTIEKGKRAGQEIERITGDMKEVTRQLREAANTLELGVSIVYEPQVYKSGAKAGQEIPGKWVVKYLAKNRKQRRNKDASQGSAAE